MPRSTRPGLLRLARLVLLAVLVALASTLARAHEMRPAIVTVAFDGTGGFTLELSANVEALIAGIGPRHENTGDSPNAAAYDRLRALPPEALRAAYEDFAPRLREGLALRFDGAAAALAPGVIDIPGAGDLATARISRIGFAGSVPEGARQMTWAMTAAFGDSIVRATGPDGAVFHSAYVPAGLRSEPIPLDAALPQPALAVFMDYLRVGFEHIVPKGLDHIFFVVGLFLLSTRLAPLLWQVTAFTVAHSVTLALGMLGIFNLPASIVEPLIALSIVYVAVENVLTDRLHRWRPLVVFCFGLLHGLGFAGVLAEIGLARVHFLTGLIAFNLGVELGQLAVIAACFLAVGFWFGSRAWYRSAITIPASLAIAAIGAWWFVERLS